MDTDLVNVPVPRQFVPNVYGLLAQLLGVVTGRADGGAATVTPGQKRVAIDFVFGEWTAGDLHRMVNESAEPMQRVLRTMAKHPGGWVTINQLAESFDLQKNELGWNKIAGMMGALGNRARSRYGLRKLPFEKRYDSTIWQKVYRMPKEVATEVLSALKTLEG